MSHEHGRDVQRCREIFARLSAYVDGELDPSWCDRLEDHLDGCPPCEVFLDSLRRTVEWVTAVDAPPLPEEVKSKVLEAVRRLDESES